MVSRAAWSTKKRAIVWSSVGVGGLLVIAVVWVGVLGVLARAELEQAAPLASEVETAIAAGNPSEAQTASAELTAHADRAVTLTSDPVWRAAEVIPWVGTNLTAVREAASVTARVASDVVGPLTSVASQLNTQTFKPVNGVVNLHSIVGLQPVVAKARRAMDGVLVEVRRIPTEGTIAPVSSAVTKLSSAVTKTTRVVDGVSNAVTLLPPMLGASGPRNYLLLFQNSAELRSTGGLPGAMAVIHTEGGRITLASQSSTAQFRTFHPPVLTLPAQTLGLYGDNPALHIEEVNEAPQFALTGQLASAMWSRRFGTNVDGVIAVDPAVLGYLLKATGPISLPDNVTLTSTNAVHVLLSQVYQLFPTNTEQDAFFATAAAAIFHKVAGGDVDSTALLKALARAGSERRVLIWSTHPSEQAVLASTDLVGALPVSTPTKAGVGVYLNDTTGAKMDYYLKVTSSVASRICRADGHPNARVTVTLKNAAPANAATALPPYVTGAGNFGVPPGSVRTKVSVYGPDGSLLVDTTSAGADFAHLAATDQGRAVSQFEIELAPGQSKTVSVDLLNLRQTTTAAYVQMTPAISTRVVSAIAPACTP